MAGIVQMLHLHKPPSDNYSYAHRKRKRLLQPRNQIRLATRLSLTVLGYCHRLLSISRGMAHAHIMLGMYRG